MNTIDIQTHREGKLVGFEPLTQAARDAMAFLETEPCCWFGRAAWIDQGFADSFAAGLQDEGLTIAKPLGE